MVVPGGVEGEVAQDFAGGGVNHVDVVVLVLDQDAGSVVVASDADVVQAAVDAQGDRSCLIDAVGSGAVVGVDAACWVSFGSAGVDGGRWGGSEHCGGRWLAGSGGRRWSAVVAFVESSVEGLWKRSTFRGCWVFGGGGGVELRDFGG